MKSHRYIMLLKKSDGLLDNNLNSAEKYHHLKHHFKRVRMQLEKWLEQKNINHKVINIEPETMFNTLFIDTTADLKKVLREFPEAIEIEEENAIAVDVYSAAS